MAPTGLLLPGVPLLSQSPDNEKEMDPGSISLYKTERKSKKMTFQFTHFSSLL